MAQELEAQLIGPSVHSHNSQLRLARLTEGAHYGFMPRACQAYRAKTKCKVKRSYRYIRADFYLARSFEDIDDMNRQLRQWLDTVAKIRCHGTCRTGIH
jgi:transposase